MTRTTSTTGNDRPRRPAGLTFMEMMVTVAVLGAGIVLIYKSFFLSLGVQDEMTRRLFARQLLDDRITAAQTYFRKQRELPPDLFEENIPETLNRRDVTFRLRTTVAELETFDDFYQVDFDLAWDERTGERHLRESALLNFF